MTILAALSLTVWLYLLLYRGWFWLPATLPSAPMPGQWPSVVAIVPARNEAAVVRDSIASLLAQDYPGAFRVMLVDDKSSDGTADEARAAARRTGEGDRLAVVSARPPPTGWTGKLWALVEGVRALEDDGAAPDLYFFTDADIAHHRNNLAELTAVLEAERRDLVSLMVLLNCASFAERLLIPAFVFFFGKLFPFAWASDPERRTAAAAGGCILIRRSAYERVGGYAAIRGALIDDCALAQVVKRGGSILLAHTTETRSLRPYPRLRDVWKMIARTAYTQLYHSPLVLAGTVLGLVLTYVLPPALALTGGATTCFAGAAWATMTIAYAPMLRFYRLSPLWAPLLPAIALVYLGATLDSAVRHWRGHGGEWKGRVQWQSRD